MKPLFVIRPPRRRSSRAKPLVIVLGGLLLLCGGGFAWGTSDHALPAHAGPVEPFSAAPPIAGLEACWIETGAAKFADSTASSLLIRHPTGALLIDAGNSTHFREEIAGLPLLKRLRLLAGPGMLRAQRPLGEHLEALKVSPESLKGVLLTHAHVDHVGGVMDLPASVSILTPAAELALAQAQGADSDVVMPAHAKVMGARVVPLEFKPTVGGPFAEMVDLFGDGSVQVVPLTGHTPGSVGVHVNLGGQRLFLAGDAINRVEELTPPRSKQAFLAGSDLDVPAAQAVVSFLAKLKEADPGLTWLPAHQRSAWVSVFGAPGSCLAVQPPQPAPSAGADVEKSSHEASKRPSAADARAAVDAGSAAATPTRSPSEVDAGAATEAMPPPAVLEPRGPRQSRATREPTAPAAADAPAPSGGRTGPVGQPSAPSAAGLAPIAPPVADAPASTGGGAGPLGQSSAPSAKDRAPIAPAVADAPASSGGRAGPLGQSSAPSAKDRAPVAPAAGAPASSGGRAGPLGQSSAPSAKDRDPDVAGPPAAPAVRAGAGDAGAGAMPAGLAPRSGSVDAGLDEASVPPLKPRRRRALTPPDAGEVLPSGGAVGAHGASAPPSAEGASTTAVPAGPVGEAAP